MRKSLLISLLLIGILLWIESHLFAQTLEVPLATGEWAPYTSEKMEGYGFFTEIVSATFKEMKHKPKYSFLPWRRGVKLIKIGKVFATFPYIVTKERQKSFDFSEKVAFTTGRFFYYTKKLPQGVPYETLSDLKPYEIVGGIGYWYETPFKEAKLKTHWSPTDKEMIKMLYKKRVDLASIDELVGWQVIRQLYPQEIQFFKTLRKPLNQSSLHLMISRKYPGAPALVKQFNAALKRIHQKGIYQKILIKYGVQE